MWTYHHANYQCFENPMNSLKTQLNAQLKSNIDSFKTKKDNYTLNIEMEPIDYTVDVVSGSSSLGPELPQLSVSRIPTAFETISTGNQLHDFNFVVLVSLELHNFFNHFELHSNRL